MNKMQIKAVLAKSDRFAITPSLVNQPIPRNLVQASKKGVTWCPTGLTEARLIEQNVVWEETFTFGCGGDQDYKMERKNGVLVEVAKPEGWTERGIRDNPLTKLVTRDGQKFIHMIVDSKALIAPWAEYTMVLAARTKDAEAKNEREKYIVSVAKKLGQKKPNTGWYTVYDKNDKRTLEGRITLTLSEAEALIEKAGL